MPKDELVTKINLTRPGASAGGGGTVITVATGGGGGSVSNADMVDGLHAAMTPVAGQLLALNGLAQFPGSVIPDISATYVPVTRQIFAGNGLTGGGTLGANVTLELGTPSTLSSTTTNSALADSHTHAITATSSPVDGSLIKGDANGKINLPALDIGTLTGASAGRLFVQKSLVLGVEDSGALPNVGRAMRLFLDGTSSRGHVLAYDYTTSQALPLTLQDAGGNVLVGVWANDNGERLQVQGDLRLAYAFDVTKYATLSVGSGGNLTLAPTGALVLNPAGASVEPQTAYTVNLGSLQKKYLAVHAAELWVNTLVAVETLATIGGRVMVGPTTELLYDLSAAGNNSQAGVAPAPGYTYVRIKHNNFGVYDIGLMEAAGKVEFFRTENHPAHDADKCYKTIGAGDYEYYFARNLDGSGANAWYAGDALFNTGSQGEGFIDLYSVRGVANSSSAGPTILMNVRNSNNYNGWIENAALGNLKGIYGYATDTYGVAFGQYLSACWITADATHGIRIFQGASARLLSRWYATDEGAYHAGDILIGPDTDTNLLLSAGAISLRNQTTALIELTAVPPRINLAGWMLLDGGGIYQGTYQAGHAGDPDYPDTGLKIWSGLDFYGNLIGRIAGFAGGVEQWGADEDGKLKAGGGRIILDAEALSLSSEGDGATPPLNFYGDYDVLVGQINASWSSLLGLATLQVLGYANATMDMYVGARRSTAERAQVRFWAGNAGTAIHQIEFNVGTADGDKPLILTQTAVQVLANLQVYRNGNYYTAYPVVPLPTAATSTSWDGDAKTTADNGTLDLSAVFGLPAGIKGIMARLSVKAAAADRRASLRSANGASEALTARTQVANIYTHTSGFCPCDANGDVFWDCNGDLTNVYLEITGYVI